MAKVPLRIYNQEIESLVDRGQHDEAIAHCRHILNAFPKNLETYRLLGKAYLEAKRYKEATDIFERVLMAVPDDFVAHVGMSIINDEQKNMDAAIWHMERAFEVQPSNAAIQSELQRLYGRRDGIEPPKIRLTRGALAHMYVQGELYPQAISEINSVLEEDAGRQDMQVLLARAYFHAGQKGEAAEMCAQLLRRYPFNLDANRVLVELLPQTERGESTQVYRHRINELDPYATFTTGSVFHTEEVSDAAVNLERLEWDGQPVDMQPEWDDGLGIRKGDGDSVSVQEEPDWLKSGLEDDESTLYEEPASDSGDLPISTSDEENDIPDFMRAAGWGADSGTFQEDLGAFDEPEESDLDSVEPIAKGDMPDWVKAMAPEISDQENSPVQAPSDADDLTKNDVPDWLEGLGDAQDEQLAEQLPQAVEAGLPDWLASMKPEGDSTTETLEQADEEFEIESDLPDWLEPLQSDAQNVTDDTLHEPVQEVPETTSESLSDWQIREEQSDAPAKVTGIGMSADEQDDALAWLEGLASKHGAKPEELVTDPEVRKESAPDWVQKSQIAHEQPESETDFSMDHEEEPIEDRTTSSTVSGLGMSIEEQDEAVAWLEGLASKHGAKPEEMVSDPEIRKDTIPDWIQKSPTVQEQSEPETDSSIDEREPAEAETILPSPEGFGMSAEEQDEAVAWLEGLASKQGAKAEELVTDPESRKETIPEWVQRASETTREQSEAKDSVPSEETQESEPDFIRDTTDEEESPYSELEELQTKEPLPAEGNDETGMWLRDLGQDAGFKEDQNEEPVADENISDWFAGLENDELDAKMAPEGEADTEPESELVNDAPEWFSELETESSGVVFEDETQSNGSEDKDLPSWLSGLEDDVVQEKSAEASGSLPKWLEAESDEEEFQLEPEVEPEPEPTAPTDWRPVEKIEETSVEEFPIPDLGPQDNEPESEPEPAASTERPPYMEPATRSRSGTTGMLSSVQEPLLVEAQNELSRSNIPAAMESYGKLIKKGKMLEEVIFDLREALYRYPVEVSIMQTLGDAYMRANRLQDALDSYTKAEELLR